MRPMIDAMAAPDDPEDLAADEEEEKEIEGEEAADFGREEADFELFACGGVSVCCWKCLRTRVGIKRACRDGKGRTRNGCSTRLRSCLLGHHSRPKRW